MIQVVSLVMSNRYEIVATERVTRNESKEKPEFPPLHMFNLETIKILLCFERWIVRNQLFLSGQTSVGNLILGRGFVVSEMPVGCLASTLNTCRASSIPNTEKKDIYIQNDFSLISFADQATTSPLFTFSLSCVCASVLAAEKTFNSLFVD